MPRWDNIQVEGQPMRAYVDVPPGGGAVPGVVVMMHGPGLERFMEDRVEDLARRGYAAVAPDLYHRQPADGGDMMTRMGKLRDTEILTDIDASVAHLRGLPDAQVASLAVLGFCMGGA
jgi:carboxymethylenebutenolidase